MAVPFEGDGQDGHPPDGLDGARLHRLLGALGSADRTGSLTDRLCHAALDIVPISGAVVSLQTEGHYGVASSASDEVAACLEQLHVTLGAGPCIDAHRQGRAVISPDLAGASPDPWPAFTELAVETGTRAAFAFPLRIGAIRVGVLGLYHTAPGMLTAAALADAVLLADITVQWILAVSGESSPAELRAVIDPQGLRAEVHQATGMVAAQLEVAVDEAFVRLQAYAYTHNRLIGDVAQEVVARLLRFDPDR